jgi:histone H3/H4
VEELVNTSAYVLSDNAVDALQRHVKLYKEMLLDRASQAAKHSQSDITSAADIDLAARELVRARSGRISRLAGLLGGVLMGAAASDALTIIPTAPSS